MKINYRIGLIFVFSVSFMLFNSRIFDNAEVDLSKYVSKKSKSIDGKKSDNALGEFSEKKKRVKGKERFDSPDIFMEIHNKIRTRVGEDEPGYRPGYALRELNKMRERASLGKGIGGNSVRALNWVERGPANVGGRTRGIAVDPDDPKKETWFTGSVGGGVWKTSDAGATWHHLTEGIPNMATSVIGQAASNHDVLYVGTGESFGNADAIGGGGMFKSTDRGNSWVALEVTTTNGMSNVSRLAIDPNNENIVVVAASTGIYKTTDGGQSFKKVSFDNTNFQDLRANPLNYNIMYAANSGRILKSTNAGDSWFLPEGQKIPSGRAEIAIALSDTSTLYASIDAEVSELYVSKNSGKSWAQVVERVEDPLYSDNTGEGVEYTWLGDQGWYDNTIAVNPYDASEVFMGGIDLWKATVSIDSVMYITGIQMNNVENTFAFTPSGLTFQDGAIGTGDELWKEKVFEPEDLVPIEVRFGPGKKQMAHRFGSNVSVYNNYVEIPFEVWDILHNKQLMVSFKDIQNNGKFNLLTTRGDELYVHAEEYNAATPSSNIGVENGAKYKNIYVILLRNASGVSWNPDALPEGSITINTGKIPAFFRETIPIVDGYNQYAGAQPSVHVDHHNIVPVPMNESTKEFKLLNGSDGGVAVSDDGGKTWRETDGNGYNTTQFYGVDKKPGASEYIGGTQDNGTWQTKSGEVASASSKYNYRIGGDGFEAAWSYGNPNNLIGGSQFNSLRRSTDGGVTWQRANNGFSDNGNSTNSPFISKVASSKIDPDFVCTISRQGVYRSDNWAEKWELTPIPTEGFHGGAYFSFAQVTISNADPSVVWAGAYLSSSGNPWVSQDGGFSFTKTNSYSEPMGLISGLDTHPTEPGTAYLTFSFSAAPKILKTTNYGQSWKDISGFGTASQSSTGFPDVATYCVVVMPYNTDIIWAGTDIGLIESTDNGASWHLANNGMPMVSIWEMKIVDDEVVVATHGRGIWSVKLPELAGYKPPMATLFPKITGDLAYENGILTIPAALRSVYDSTMVTLDDQPIAKIFNTVPVDTTLQIEVPSKGQVEVRLVSYKNQKAYKSTSRVLSLVQFKAPAPGFVTNFDADANDFALEKLTIGNVDGFNNGILHSEHPYAEAATSTDDFDVSNFTATLLTPIIVSETNATLTYDDVAIVEPGDAGVPFGQNEFWDYVIVEGSKDDGNTWLKLLDGYDARLDAKWLNAYNSGSSGNSSMFVSHTINLRDVFAANDIILIRFRLLSDEATTAWGWAIDNLKIQPQLVGVEDSEIPVSYSLNQNFPNPFNPSTVISFAVPKLSSVKLKVYNSIGQLVTTLVDEVKSAGNYKINWNAASMASGIYYYRIEAGNFVDTKKMVLIK